MPNKSETAGPTPSKEMELPSAVPEVKMDFVEVLSVIWNAKKLIGLVVGATTVIAVVVSLVLPETFKSEATILPATGNGKLAGMSGGLSDLASVAGVSLGEAPLTVLYPVIINSETILKKAIYACYRTPESQDSANLIQIWETGGKLQRSLTRQR